MQATRHVLEAVELLVANLLLVYKKGHCFVGRDAGQSVMQPLAEVAALWGKHFTLIP